MPVTRPYKRNVRQFTDGDFSEGGRWKYVIHNKYAQSPEHFIRAFLLLQKDLFTIFDFVEPSDKNLDTYSFRIHELLLRTCVEIESNCVAILTENGYKKNGNWNMDDYKKINPTHRLSSYDVKLPVWTGSNNIRKPFKEWANNSSLSWYKAYNETKHDRHTKFEQATFENLLDAICGLVALLSSQFLTHDFSPGDWLISAGGPDDGMGSAIGNYFRLKFPTDWPDEEKYEFKWQDIERETEPFQKYNY